ncbi:MAG: DUF1801 domain-containing protein [Chitinophagaceae bacterium]|nr:MAG: DUF1801 domain-containing protein [Chitinophagaceae bacterium]
MTSAAPTVQEYFAQLPEDRQAAMTQLFDTLQKHLPKGFEPRMAYGMITWVVPHSTYPAGYHCDPKMALPFISIASQKNFVALYHMGIYSDSKLHDWFLAQYPKHSKTKSDMGKSCIRFKKPDQIPFDLIAQLAEKMNPRQWIEAYERGLKREA